MDLKFANLVSDMNSDSEIKYCIVSFLDLRGFSNSKQNIDEKKGGHFNILKLPYDMGKETYESRKEESDS